VEVLLSERVGGLCIAEALLKFAVLQCEFLQVLARRLRCLGRLLRPATAWAMEE